MVTKFKKKKKVGGAIQKNSLKSIFLSTACRLLKSVNRFGGPSIAVTGVTPSSKTLETKFLHTLGRSPFTVTADSVCL